MQERDACGIGFVADSKYRSTRGVVEGALEALINLRHRGAVAADSKTGDGAGLLLPIPPALRMDDEFVGLAMCFVWGERLEHRKVVQDACKAEGIDVIEWREVPTEIQALGSKAAGSAPEVEQALLLRPVGVGDDEAELRCLRARKRAERALSDAGIRAYFPSFSFRTVTYKALVSAPQLPQFYPDLRRPDFIAPFAIFHQRFSTNTDPSWERAQPFRMICHNGEINTISGNISRMQAREGRLGKTDLLEEEVLRPLIDSEGSDSAVLDNAVELLTREGRDVTQALAMLIPAAWQKPSTPERVRAFYRFQWCLMEAWDGPAGIIFTDGKQVGARLDRNGLRPLRYHVCEDGLIACASEAGAVSTSGHGVIARRKLGPGEMICLSPETGLDLDPVSHLAERHPYDQWLDAHLVKASVSQPPGDIPDDIITRQIAFGYTREEFTTIIRPMATSGHEPTSSMGDDTAPAVLAQGPRPLYNYFKQRFAQVTNPAIDHLRERGVMSLGTLIGPRDPLLRERAESAALLELESFFLNAPPGGHRLDASFAVEEGPAAMRRQLEEICEEAEQAARRGSGILVISDQQAGPNRAPIPMLLALGAVHTRLMRSGDRTRTSLVVETDEAREVHHFACLLGYGAEAICPRLVLASLADLINRGRLGEPIDLEEATRRFRSAVEEGVLKVLSKMGISMVDSYRGAEIFDAIGLAAEVIDECFPSTSSPVGGLGFDDIATEVLVRHLGAYSGKSRLGSPGFFKHHPKGEYHATNPDVVDTLQAAVDDGRWKDYSQFAKVVNERPPTELRDLLDFKPAPPIPLEEVEPVSAITRRFSTGAISHGAIGAEAHETLARALNMIGGKANTGEGGEDPARYRTDSNCKIKQVASGRFGVTAEYCSFAEELQIKIAQGSKPGEGGQLPGHKVTQEIARLRHTQPGVALISPPPHHDIYSIEDLAQLIFDLKQVNPRAAVSVKLVAEVGVGTIAAGVAKALADVIHISGSDGGTGASPLSSIKNAGLPWELGLAETHQTLIGNELRDRVRLRIDGGMKSGRDVVLAAALGADEFSFGTSVLVAEGCIMVRACHRDTCPVGIATQRPELRAKFTGTPEKVARYLEFVAEEIRRILAGIGMRSLGEVVGRSDLLFQREALPGSTSIDLSVLLAQDLPVVDFLKAQPVQSPRSELGNRLHEDAYRSVADGETINLRYDISNSDRSVGARLGGAIGHQFGESSPPGKAVVAFQGQAGQSFGAFLTNGIEFALTGEANDYVGKAMSGGLLAIIPPADDAGDPYLCGNTVLYGATGGQLFVAGKTGERFAVRNSGADAVVEGVGEHGCEYMTGGQVVVLGEVGFNFGAGMTGGRAFVWDAHGTLGTNLNTDLVGAKPLTESELPALLEAIAAHLEATGSERAKWILENWEVCESQFVHVSPHDQAAQIESAREASVAARA